LRSKDRPAALGWPVRASQRRLIDVTREDDDHNRDGVDSPGGLDVAPRQVFNGAI
jgi:hypothetical protein